MVRVETQVRTVIFLDRIDCELINDESNVVVERGAEIIIICKEP